MAITTEAKDPVFPKPPEGFRIGMEIELQEWTFKNITGYFDLESLQTKRGAEISAKLPKDFFDDYLQNNPQALAEFPADLRNTLTAGSPPPENTVLRAKQPLLGTTGEPLVPQAGLILLERKIQAPQGQQKPRELVLPENTKTNPARFQNLQNLQTQGDLLVPGNTAWQNIFKKWKGLSFEVKQSLVRWENLSSLNKATLVMRYGEGKVDLKTDLPTAERKIFERFQWSLDGFPLEFRHREDLMVTDSNEFYRDVAHLARRAGVESKILDPGNSKITGANLHYHISVAGKDLTKQGEALNHLAMIRRLKLGILNDLTKREPNTYHPTARTKGLVRVISKDRIEFRSHYQSLEEELRFNLEVLSLDTERAVAKVGLEIQGMMTDHIVDLMAKYRSKYLADFLKYMTPEQQARVQPKLELARYVEFQGRNLPDDFWDRAPDLLRSPDLDVRTSTYLKLQDENRWPEKFFREIPALMTHPQPEVHLAVANALMRQSQWTKEVWEAVPGLMKSSNSDVRNAMLTTLGHQPYWTEEVLREAEILKKNPDPIVQHTLATALMMQPCPGMFRVLDAIRP